MFALVHAVLEMLEGEGSILAGVIELFFSLFWNLIIFDSRMFRALFGSKNTVPDLMQSSFCIYYMLLLAILVLFVSNWCYFIWLPCKFSGSVTTVLLAIFCNNGRKRLTTKLFKLVNIMMFLTLKIY